ncbi:type I-E CRISPR-associated protein Cse1/CasA [Lentilactobacillus sp. TOM.63]|uniref:type I-E CRISPR-associated protein Cse1/CasA n=1 Tax=Lentilactobacillus sp. TOM.63 TaxID=3055077 RepID=UPI0025A07605|nr:type I-E CRISPR-associated protein Cse1/CasA [Lentilactobacillus sp. TOM.63]MDM7517353.1 type I-E CRISPR-associated protein Cse1/CasA [Lentilactobacillus sp. TOM.63]
MEKQHFNLTTDSWIKVIDRQTNQEQMVSLIELFENAQNYRALSGEMRSQDLAILRFLLAILTAVYSRFDADDEPYDWVTVDEDSMRDTGEVDRDDQENIEEDLFDTWKQLFNNGHFTQMVITYLKRYADRFDLFGEQPFYQVTEDDYNHFVPKKKQIAGAEGPGTVAIKQINRQISESGHTPSLFSPKSDEFKNDIQLDELARWLITYQNFTGVTDKTKIEMPDKFSTASGWLYKLGPVFADGDTLFQTLMLNLVLVEEDKPYNPPKPVWEQAVPQYVEDRKKQNLPDNLAELYTTWSRLLHINWDEQGTPTIFSAGLPMFESDDAFIEPMTVWRFDKRTDHYRPAVKGLRSLGTAMWRNFGQYVQVEEANDKHEPEIVKWLRVLKDRGLIPQSTLLTLASVALISDGNATSQSPVAEVYDDMHINADVLFDENPDKAQRWPIRIEDMIELTQKVGSDYWRFAVNIAHIRNLDYRPFANKMSAAFYDGLNGPFNKWLRSLTNEEDRDKKSNEWKKEIKSYVLKTANEVIQSSSPRDMAGFIDVNGVVDKSKGLVNIFTVNNRLRYQVQADLKS